MMNVLRRWWYTFNQMLDEAANKREARRLARQRAYLIQQQIAAQQWQQQQQYWQWQWQQQQKHQQQQQQQRWPQQQQQQWQWQQQQMDEWIEDDEDLYYEEHMMHEIDHDFDDHYDF